MGRVDCDVESIAENVFVATVNTSREWSEHCVHACGYSADALGLHGMPKNNLLVALELQSPV